MSTPTYPHKWWALALCLVMAVVAGLGAVALLIGLNQAALAVLSGGFVFFLGGYHAALAFVKAAGLVH